MSRWPSLSLSECLIPAGESVPVEPEGEYPNFGIYSFGKGLFEKAPIRGLTSSARTLTRVKAGQFIYSRLFAFEGAYGVVPDRLDGYHVSNEYPVFDCSPEHIDAGYLGWYFKQPAVSAAIAQGSKGLGVRRQRVQPEQVLRHRIPRPPLAEQRRIVARLDTLADKVRQIAEKLDAIEADSERLLAARFRETIAGAPRLAMGGVAPVIRRNVDVQIDRCYREVGARSFGKGLFPKPDFDGAEATWQKPVWIERGDLVVSNIKAWEGAFAVAEESHHGCIASHRYLTCVPNPEIATPHFLRYYLLTSEGLEQIGLASPGTADRNRTLSQSSLGEIVVPVPRIETQRSFDSLQSRVASLKSHHAAIREANSALLPAMLERLFRQYA